MTNARTTSVRGARLRARRIFCEQVAALALLGIVQGCSQPELPARTPARASSQVAAWPMFRGNAQRTGLGLSTPRIPPRLQFRFGTAGEVWASPALGPDSSVYATSLDGRVYAISPEGRPLWIYATRGALWASPAIRPDGSVVVAGVDSHLYVIREGALLWERDLDNCAFSSPLIMADGSIVVGSGSHRLHAFAADGSNLWSVSAGAAVDSSPSLDHAGHFVVGTRGAGVLVVTRDGGVVARFRWPRPLSSTIAVRQDGSWLLGTADGVLAVREGRVLWHGARGADLVSSPGILPDGSLVVGAKDGQVYGLDASGSTRWQVRTGGPITSSPAIARDGTAWIGSNDGKLYAIDVDGNVVWSTQLGGPIHSSPAIGVDGTIAVGSRDGAIYVFR